ncbi:MAG: hypothetical protein ACI8WT_001571 [Clostridium sp.]|jgi:hypothetical protein
MKSLYELCIPRDSVFDETKRDDVLDLSNLVDNTIDVNEFFIENYMTEGMKTLTDTAFNRFLRRGATGVIKLTQSMGGGKTHNQIALGLLAKHPEIRAKILGKELGSSHLGKIKVVAFTGRESDAPYGIWGAIAKQLGKEKMFENYYSPLKAPGQSAWINLLQGEPLLILLDELPPYLENGKSIQIGNSDLSVMTTTALANLFTALGKEELSNVCLVISDLTATYESGSELLQSAFKELENEVSRSAINIEPVGSTSDEIYHILRKRLFSSLPQKNDITEIATAYRDAVKQTKQMGYTNLSPEQIWTSINDSYPFHPSIKDLFARFKENPGFQQTRGFIRLMRLMVSQLYRGKNPIAKNLYIINSYNFDLNDREMFAMIKSIKNSLVNAISHDISSNGKSVAEELCITVQNKDVSDLSKLLLISSLSNATNAVIGLSIEEAMGYICAPGKDITGLKSTFEDFKSRAWYLYSDKERIFFKDIKNVNAELISLVQGYDKETAKKEIRIILQEKFKPSVLDCYQSVLVFPPIDEIELQQDKVTIILFEPNSMGSGLQKDLKAFYDNAKFKNRAMFLTGQRNSMEGLINIAKEHKGIQSIISRMDGDKVAKSDSQYLQATVLLHKISLNLLQSIRESFVTLYYPIEDGLTSSDFMMEFQNNNFNGEEQIKKILIAEEKFETDVSSDLFRGKCERRIFTQKTMRWIDIKERASTTTSWQWHLPRAMDDLKNECLKKGLWREDCGYIEKSPFPEPDTTLMIQEVYRDEKTGEVTLKLTPQYGDTIYYEINTEATTSSLEVKKLNEFKTKELNLSFICEDSSHNNKTGDAVYWKNRIILTHRVYDKNNNKYVELKAIPNAVIKYTTEGSAPKENGGIYNGDFVVPKSCKLVLAIAMAEKQGIYTEVKQIQINTTVQIIHDKPLKLNRHFKTNNTAETYKTIEDLKKHNAAISEVSTTLYEVDDKNIDKGWIEINFDSKTMINVTEMEQEINNLQLTFMKNKSINISIDYGITHFETGQDFMDWVAENKYKIDDYKSDIEQKGAV